MKEVPLELVTWGIGLILAGLGAFLSFATHLLIRINSTVQQVSLNQTIQHAANRTDIESLKRHDERNEKEVEWMKRHLQTSGAK